MPTYPNVLQGDVLNAYETSYPCPVPDFGLTKIAIPVGEAYTIHTNSLEMLLVMEGEVRLGTLLLKAGDVAMLTAGQSFEINAIGSSVLFKSYVP